LDHDQLVSVPGRVNLIGEHIDYHNLPVLPMAIQRQVRVAFRPREDRRIRASSPGFPDCDFEWTDRLEPGDSGGWSNYVKAAAQAVTERWGAGRGIDAEVTSDLPPAAGLSSSSALLTAFTLALLEANGIRAGFEELMDVLPEGEHFVGTRGGGMDHAAVLASRAGCALLVNFAPVSVEHVPIPRGWAFLVAHSLTTAEKSHHMRAEYNARRTAGTRGLARLGLPSYAEAVERFDEVSTLARGRLDEEACRCFLHVAGEAVRVRKAVAALRAGDAESFGKLLYASHESLRDLLRISNPSLDELVEAARESGARGARLTGAGFGGCAVVFCDAAERDRIGAELVRRYYSRRAGFDPEKHLIAAEPSSGALNA
jgi:galactokinase